MNKTASVLKRLIKGSQLLSDFDVIIKDKSYHFDNLLVCKYGVLNAVCLNKKGELYGNENDLIERIRKDDIFGLSSMELEVLLDPVKFTGMAEYQCEKFVNETVKPFLEREQRVDTEAQVNV